MATFALTGERIVAPTGKYRPESCQGTMGYETRVRRRLPSLSTPIAAHHRYLGEYGDFTSYALCDDVEAEQATYPDLIDQTRLHWFCGPTDFDDMEDDDPAGGEICDEPHDAREEDGA